MLIGVDGNEANIENKVGVSVYTYELLHYFQQQASAEVSFVIYLRLPPREELPQENKFFKYEVVSGSKLWSQIFFPLYLYTHLKPDILFCPAHYAPRFSPVKTIVTVHDLSYFYFPNEFLKKDLYQLKHWTKYSINKASKIIAVSKTTKKDIMKLCNIPDEKIEVIYNGYREEKSQNSNSKTKINTKYLLYVGTIQPRKNLNNLLIAFKNFLSNNSHYKLIIAGKKGWLSEPIYEKVKQLGLEKNVVFTGYISDAELDNLYSRAEAFVLPSFYEGFGLPILEALSRGTPVITSFQSSLPEVGGDACLYFDPSSPADIKEKIEIIVSNKTLRKELIQKGKERVKLFSWEKCGKETLELIKNSL